MDCRHNHSPLRYCTEIHPWLVRIRYTGLHALHRHGHVEWRGYLHGHIRVRSDSGTACRLRLAMVRLRERVAHRAMLYALRHNWLGPEAGMAIRKALEAGEQWRLGNG